jgi:predicted DNA-binding transcriptional regulator AlpA
MRSVAGLPKLGLKPEDVAEIPPKHLASLLAGLAALQGAVAARLADGAMAGETNGNGANTVADEMLTAEQAARRTGLSRRSLYARAAELPFAIRVGRRAVRFSARGVDRWLAKRKEQQQRTEI